VLTPKGARVDTPGYKPLEHFTNYPLLRDESGDFCYLCKPDQRIAAAKKQSVRAEVRRLGTINGFAVYDIFYYFGDNETPGWKSLVVRTGPNAYQEIYHDQPTQGHVNPSFEVRAGSTILVGVLDEVYRADEVREYFWLEPAGVVRVDFMPAVQAAQRVIPGVEVARETGPVAGRGPRAEARGRRIYSQLDIDFGAMTILVRTISDLRCCDKGVAKLRFRLDRGRVTITGAEFDPEADF
jgi:hypothetical protein